jgi:hypothetical protein
MLLVSATNMNRKGIALAVVLLLAVLAPATAIIGFCTRMPCCSHAAADAAPSFATERTDCCTTITCYDAPTAKLMNRAASPDVVVHTPALLAVATTISAPPVARREVVDTSPPTSPRQRLAVLSVLLI